MREGSAGRCVGDRAPCRAVKGKGKEGEESSEKASERVHCGTKREKRRKRR